MSGNMPKTFTGPAVFSSVKIFKDNTELTGYVLTDGTLQFQFFGAEPERYSNVLEVWNHWVVAKRRNEGRTYPAQA